MRGKPGSIIENSETDELDELIRQLSVIRTKMLELETAALAEQCDLHQSHSESAKNLLHYLALRRHDLRGIQKRLAAHGLSSLGRAESHVRANVDAIENLLSLISNNGHGAPEAPSQRFRESLYRAVLLRSLPAHQP